MLFLLHTLKVGLVMPQHELVNDVGNWQVSWLQFHD
jgi:hypothetical protein